MQLYGFHWKAIGIKAVFVNNIKAVNWSGKCFWKYLKTNKWRVKGYGNSKSTSHLSGVTAEQIEA